MELNVNPCASCQPLGAILALKGVENSMILVHGSQGCSTYMRLYLTRHFREPFDVASSSLNEKEAVYGGARNLVQGIRNVIARYRPQVLTVATTCLSETIGDDVAAILDSCRDEAAESGTELVAVSTPSYSGTITEGFGAAVEALVDHFTAGSGRDAAKSPASRGTPRINLLLPHISPVETRELRQVISAMGIMPILLPDNGDSLDPPLGIDLPLIPEGGTPLDDLRGLGQARASLAVSADPRLAKAASLIAHRTGAPAHSAPLPLGLVASDNFFETLAALAGCDIPRRLERQRGRLLDAMADAHRLTYGRRVAVIGEPHMVGALCRFGAEQGFDVRVAATGSRETNFEPGDAAVLLSGADYATFARAVRGEDVELVVGSSHASYLGQELGVPLLRVGFPVYDRFGGHRLSYLGYEGSVRLLDAFCNSLLENETRQVHAR